MKIPILSTCLLAALVMSSNAQTEWNKEEPVVPPVPGATPVKAIMHLSGTGAVIQKKGAKCVVTDFLRPSGAAEAGVQKGDVITHVNGEEVASLTLLEIAQRLRGEPDTKVNLTIQRPGETQPRVYTVVRHPVN